MKGVYRLTLLDEKKQEFGWEKSDDGCSIDVLLKIHRGLDPIIRQLSTDHSICKNYNLL